jgi:hypothetical protein
VSSGDPYRFQRTAGPPGSMLDQNFDSSFLRRAQASQRKDDT